VSHSGSRVGFFRISQPCRNPDLHGLALDRSCNHEGCAAFFPGLASVRIDRAGVAADHLKLREACKVDDYVLGQSLGKPYRRRISAYRLERQNRDRGTRIGQGIGPRAGEAQHGLHQDAKAGAGGGHRSAWLWWPF
jgi:hypothetical protein